VGSPPGVRAGWRIAAARIRRGRQIRPGRLRGCELRSGSVLLSLRSSMARSPHMRANRRPGHRIGVAAQKKLPAKPHTSVAGQGARRSHMFSMPESHAVWVSLMVTPKASPRHLARLRFLSADWLLGAVMDRAHAQACIRPILSRAEGHAGAGVGTTQTGSYQTGSYQ